MGLIVLRYLRIGYDYRFDIYSVFGLDDLDLAIDFMRYRCGAVGCVDDFYSVGLVLDVGTRIRLNDANEGYRFDRTYVDMDDQDVSVYDQDSCMFDFADCFEAVADLRPGSC